MTKKVWTFIFLIFMIPSMCGCVALVAGAAGGAGTAAWLSGKLTQEVDATFDKTISASRSALKFLRLEVTKETRKDDVAQIMSKYYDGKTVWIDIRKIDRSISKIEVRVGAVGDEDAARKILDKILRYL